MSTTNTIKLMLGYTGTDFVRKQNITDVAASDADVETVRAKVKAVNASLEAGTADGLETFFRADDYDAQESIGAFAGVTQAVIDNTETTIIIA